MPPHVLIYTFLAAWPVATRWPRRALHWFGFVVAWVLLLSGVALIAIWIWLEMGGAGSGRPE